MHGIRAVVAALVWMVVFGFHTTRAEPSPTRIKIATFNAKLMPWPLNDSTSYTHLDRPTVDYETRLNTLAGVASPDLNWSGRHPVDAGFDIIGYQEVWRGVLYDQHFSRLRERLVAQGIESSDIVRGRGHLFDKGYNHGLVIASRYPVLEIAELQFGTAAGWDLLAQKGVLFARIDVKGTEVAVFNTHLQSAAGDASENRGIRADHLKKLRAFMEEHTRHASAVVVMGDFNIRRFKSPECENAEYKTTEYCQWFSNRADYGDWNGFVDNGPTESRGLDYILTRHLFGADAMGENHSKAVCVAPGRPAKAVKCDDRNRYGAVTDHPLVFGEYKIVSGVSTLAPRGKAKETPMDRGE